MNPNPFSSPVIRSLSIRKKRQPTGFTLLEMMMSMMVLVIGITAVISMQKSAMDAHSANRDTQIAGGIADQFLEMLQLDALRWTSNLNNTTSYIKTNIPLGGSIAWAQYTAAPINYQMRGYTNNSGTDIVGTGDSFCLYHQQRWAGTDANVPTFRDELVEIDVAVLTPRNPSGLTNNHPQCPNANTLFQRCDIILLNDNSCQIEARRQLFRRISRAILVRRNRSAF